MKASWGGPVPIRIDGSPTLYFGAGAVAGGLFFRRDARGGTVAERSAGMAGPTAGPIPVPSSLVGPESGAIAESGSPSLVGGGLRKSRIGKIRPN